MWSFIPEIHVATLQHSKRRNRLEKDLLQMGILEKKYNEQIPPLEKTFENITMSCTDNHLSIYRKASLTAAPFICVLEDDVFVPQCHRIKEILEDISQFLHRENDWDLVYLGHLPWKIGRKRTAHIYESVSWCTHAYLISQRGMQFMLKYSPRDILDTGRLVVPYLFDLFFKEGGGIDTFIAYHAWQGNLKTFAVCPFLVHQYSIPNWSKKAQLAEMMAWYGFWPKHIVMTCFVVCFVLILLLSRWVR